MDENNLNSEEQSEDEQVWPEHPSTCKCKGHGYIRYQAGRGAQLIFECDGEPEEVWTNEIVYETIAQEVGQISSDGGRFRIDNLRKADWFAEKYLNLLTKEANAKAAAKKYKAKAEALLRAFGCDLIPLVVADTKGKSNSVMLESGRIGFTVNTDRIDIGNSTVGSKAGNVAFIREYFPELADQIKSTTTYTVPIPLVRSCLEHRIRVIGHDEDGSPIEIHDIVVKGTDTVVDFKLKPEREPYIKPK